MTAQVSFHNHQCYSSKDSWTTLSPRGLTMTHSVNCKCGHIGQVLYIMQRYSDKGAVPATQSVFLWNRGVNTWAYLTDVLVNRHSFGGIWDSWSRPDLNPAAIVQHIVSFWISLESQHLRQMWWESHHSESRMLWEENGSQIPRSIQGDSSV